MYTPDNNDRLFVYLCIEFFEKRDEATLIPNNIELNKIKDNRLFPSTGDRIR